VKVLNKSNIILHGNSFGLLMPSAYGWKRQLHLLD
jgi:hypothetical protein